MEFKFMFVSPPYPSASIISFMIIIQLFRLLLTSGMATTMMVTPMINASRTWCPMWSPSCFTHIITTSAAKVATAKNTPIYLTKTQARDWRKTARYEQIIEIYGGSNSYTHELNDLLPFHLQYCISWFINTPPSPLPHNNGPFENRKRA